MTKVLITGSEGTIGSVLCRGLSDFEVSGYDLPKYDALNYEQLVGAARGQDVLIHLAWNTKVDNWKSDELHLESIEMANNVFKAAQEAGVSVVPDNFAIVYGVSNNVGTVHDTTNPFGWTSQDGA